MRVSLLSGVMLGGLALTTVAGAQVEGPTPVRVIVRADGKSAASPLQPTDIRVEFNGHDVPVASFQPLMRANDNGPRSGPRLEVAVLIDDGLRSQFGNQMNDVERFVKGIASPQVAVGVGYMENGRAVFQSGFSTDAEVAAKGIHLPSGPVGVSGSPYFCLQELVKHWPTDTGAARVVLMITNGIDLYNGSTSPLNQDSSYVQATIRDAQRAGVPVYSIYFGNRELNSDFGSASGQSYLSQVGEETGGKLFNSGTINPVSIGTYFSQFETALRESYILRFTATSPKLERLKVSTKVDGVKVHTQNEAEASSGTR